jgi:hypothetical protein
MAAAVEVKRLRPKSGEDAINFMPVCSMLPLFGLV